MNKLFLLAAVPLTLASCGLIGLPQSLDVSGSVLGTPPAGTVRLALVGANASGVVQDGSQQAAITLSPSDKRYAVDLPADWKQKDGYYNVVAYVDADNDGMYDAGEQSTSHQGSYLVYDVDGQNALISGIRAGLNEVKGTTAVQWGKIGGYDLTW